MPSSALRALRGRPLPKSSEPLFECGAHSLEECEARDAGTAAERGKVAGHRARADGVEAGIFQLLCKHRQRRIAVQFAALGERTRPCENGRNRVGGRLLALEVAVLVPRDRAVCGLIFKVAVR